MFSTRLFRPATQLSQVSEIQYSALEATTRIEQVADMDDSQQVRRYASEAPKSGGGNGLVIGAAAVGLLGGGYYAFAGKKDPVAAAEELTKAEYKNKTPAQGGPPDKVFIGGGIYYFATHAYMPCTDQKQTRDSSA